MSSPRNVNPRPAFGLLRLAHSVAVLVVVFAMRCYQAMVRPFLLGSCKFYPTCSEYGIQALQLHGLWRGSILTFRRIGRCHPFTSGGIDPVPKPATSPRRTPD